MVVIKKLSLDNRVARQASRCQHAFSKPCLVNLLSKYTHLVFSISLFLVFCVWSLFCFVIQCLVSCLALNHLDEEERAGYFTLIVFLMFCDCYSVLCVFLTLPWVDLQCVIVIFPDQTHLLFTCVALAEAGLVVGPLRPSVWSSVRLSVRPQHFRGTKFV